MATKDYSYKQEHKIAAALGWHVVTGSGSRVGHPGDIIGEQWLGECKTHVSGNHPITFKASVWNKIKDEATAVFKYPVLFVDDGSQELSKTWCIVSNTVKVSDVCIVDYPYKIKSNLTFNRSDITHVANSDIVFHVKHFKFSCYLMMFDTFNRLFGE